MSLPRDSIGVLLLFATLLLVQHQIKDFEAKLGEGETHLAEFGLGFVTEDMRSVCPEGSDRLANDFVCGGSVTIHETCVGNLALGGGVDAVDLGMCKRFQLL